MLVLAICCLSLFIFGVESTIVKAAVGEPGRRLGELPAERDRLALAWDRLSRPAAGVTCWDCRSGGW
jgi:hypothetical protein